MVTLDSLIVQAASKKDPVVAVASAADVEVLEAVSIAIAKGIASFMLFDDEKRMKELIQTDFPHLLDECKKSAIHHANDDVQMQRTFR